MSKDKDYSAAHEAVIRKWRNEEESRRDSAEHVEKSVRRTMANILKSRENLVNIAKDLKNATSNPKTYRNEGGFSSTDDELITGFEERPWDRD